MLMLPFCRTTLLMLFSCLLLHACTKTEINANYDKYVDFSRYKTFAWLPKQHFAPLDVPLPESVIDERILAYVNSQMIGRGIGLDIQNPDLLIDYTLNIAYQDTPIAAPFYRSQFNWLGAKVLADAPLSISTPTDYRYAKIASKQGTLTISLIDRQNKQIIWQGWAESSIVEPADLEMLLPKDIVKMFKKFPIVIFESK